MKLEAKKIVKLLPQILGALSNLSPLFNLNRPYLKLIPKSLGFPNDTMCKIT